MTKTIFVVEFERLGRRHDFTEEIIGTTDHDDPFIAEVIAERIYRIARKSLASTWFEVTVEMTDDEGKFKGSIDAGRFGQFTGYPKEPMPHED